MLVDGFGRTIDYLRVSVTKTCNFRCQYCMPSTPIEKQEELLSADELFLFLKEAIDIGIKKIRITGGEPTLRADLPDILQKIFSYMPDLELALTTNGFLMDKYAKLYADSGLKKINISLDSLKEDIASKIAGEKNVLSKVLSGIQACLDANIRVKLNMVPLKGINENEILDILDFAQQKDIMIRFIEQMSNTYAPNIIGLLANEMLEIISKKYSFINEVQDFKSPANLYKLNNGYVFGIIEPHKDHFCKSCNRIRLSADGSLIPCLYFNDAISIKEYLKAGDSKIAIEVFKELVKNKPEKNKWQERESSNRAFYYTGG